MKEKLQISKTEKVLGIIITIIIVGSAGLVKFSQIYERETKRDNTQNTHVVAPIKTNNTTGEISVCPHNGGIKLNCMTYKIDIENHVVYDYFKNIPGSLKELKDCAIIDLNNWKCTYSDKSSTFGFQNGEYFLSPNYGDDYYTYEK